MGKTVVINNPYILTMCIRWNKIHAHTYVFIRKPRFSDGMMVFICTFIWLGCCLGGMDGINIAHSTCLDPEKDPLWASSHFIYFHLCRSFSLLFSISWPSFLNIFIYPLKPTHLIRPSKHKKRNPCTVPHFLFRYYLTQHGHNSIILYKNYIQTVSGQIKKGKKVSYDKYAFIIKKQKST